VISRGAAEHNGIGKMLRILWYRPRHLLAIMNKGFRMLIDYLNNNVFRPFI
jgi:hypothetical protein